MKRASGRTPQAASAYRRGIRLVGPDGTVHDYRRRARGIRATAIFAPEGCDWVQDPQTLWDRANAAERRQDSRTAREYEIALPAELPWPERQRLAEAFAQHLVEQFGVAVDLAIHEPAADGKHDERNHHAHFLTTTRTVTPDGMGEKTRALDLKTTSPALIEALRAEWARMANEALARHNAALIDHRSHKRRELEVLPTKHEGPRVTWWRRLRVRDEDWSDGFMDRARENDAILAGNVTIIERVRRMASAAKNVGGLLKGLLVLPQGLSQPPAQSFEAAIASARRADAFRATSTAPGAAQPIAGTDTTSLPRTTDAEIIRNIEAAKAEARVPLAGLQPSQAMSTHSPSPPTDTEIGKDGDATTEGAEKPPDAQGMHADGTKEPTQGSETAAEAEDDDDGAAASGSASQPVDAKPIETPDKTNGRHRPR